jgi:hypothetical protein
VIGAGAWFRTAHESDQSTADRPRARFWLASGELFDVNPNHCYDIPPAGNPRD